jgi:hypothetical protein
MTAGLTCRICGQATKFICSFCKREIRPDQQAVAFHRGWLDLAAVPTTDSGDYPIWLDKLQHPQVKGTLACGECSQHTVA